ncbi:MAG TPA: hypothetical protein VFV10_13365 [Gammaproteobacteria bacterium]|nr:hypothetical protein [Gammaproteobacteria bacterium]
MKTGNRLIAAVVAAFLSAAASAEAPIATDMPEYIVTAKSPDAPAADEIATANPPAPIAVDAAFDAASVLKEMQAEQKAALKAALSTLLDGQTSH